MNALHSHVLPLLLLAQEGAPDAADPAPPGAGPSMFMPLILIGVVFYFLLIRPESKKRKRHEEFLRNLSKGDKVLTTGGLLGTVTAIQEDVVTLQVAPNVRMRFLRGAIQGTVGDEVKETEAGGGRKEEPSSEETQA